ncbi:metalloregulator ArsR/SmtB family transcription factor [Lachnospiraceae bacterium 54-53]
MDYVHALHTITDPTRYQILQLLLERHYCVRAISKKLGISEPAVSQQMKILKRIGIVSGTKMGYHMHYLVNTDILDQVFKQFSQDLNSVKSKENLTTECICEYECGKKHKIQWTRGN